MIDGQARPRALPLITADDVADAVVHAIRRRRFEVWVPRSQGASAKLAAILPRAVRELLYRALGVTRIAGDTDQERRRAIAELGSKAEITRFKGLGEISPEEFAQFIGDDIRKDPVLLHCKWMRQYGIDKPDRRIPPMDHVYECRLRS